MAESKGDPFLGLAIMLGVVLFFLFLILEQLRDIQEALELLK